MLRTFGADQFLREERPPAVPERFAKASLLQVGRALPAATLPHALVAQHRPPCLGSQGGCVYCHCLVWHPWPPCRLGVCCLAWSSLVCSAAGCCRAARLDSVLAGPGQVLR